MTIEANNTHYSPEAVALMASRIAELERENEKLQANWRLQRDIISDLQEHVSGALSLLLTQERETQRAQAWAKRWKRAAKRVRNRYRQALRAQDQCWQMVTPYLNERDDRLHLVRYTEFVNPRAHIAAVLKGSKNHDD